MYVVRYFPPHARAPRYRRFKTLTRALRFATIALGGVVLAR